MRAALVALSLAASVGLAACGNDGTIELTPAQTPVGVGADTPIPTRTPIPADE